LARQLRHISVYDDQAKAPNNSHTTTHTDIRSKLLQLLLLLLLLLLLCYAGWLRGNI